MQELSNKIIQRKKKSSILSSTGSFQNMALDLLYLCFKSSYSPFIKNPNFDFQIFWAAKYYKGNQGAGLHQEQGGRLAEVGVLSRLSNFLSFKAMISVFYIKYLI